MRANEHIRYEPDEKPPPLLTVSVAAQGALIALANTVTFVTIFAVASDGSEGFLSWSLFASMVIAGAVIALQSTRFGRLGSGHILLMGSAVPFLAVCVLAVSEGGLPVMSSLIVAASLAQFALAFWLAQLRRIITPVVSGITFMLLAASAMPIAVARLDDVPSGLPAMTGPAVGGVTLIVGAVLILRGSGLWRLLAIPITILTGWVAAVLLGAFDFQPALDAPWFALPEFSAWPGLSPVTDTGFLGLLPVFLIVSAVAGVRISSEGASIQQVSWRNPRAVDFRGVQGTLNAGGLGVLLCGLAGVLPIQIYLPSTVALISFSGVSARRIGLTVGITLIALALLPKIVAIFLTIPRPVTGSVSLILMGLLFMEGLRTILQDGLNPQKVLIVGLSLSIGLGLQTENILVDILGSPWGVALGNSVIVGIMTALLLGFITGIGSTRRRRLETTLEPASQPGIDAFLRDLGSGMGWSQPSVERLCAAGEETLSSMLALSDDYEGQQSPRLVLVARPGSGTVEMEFLVLFTEENIEDRIAYMSEQAETPDISEVSFRLLRHYASSVRHRKYHGIDIVTVQVDA